MNDSSELDARFGPTGSGAPRVRLLLSGGGFRGMIGAVGVMLTLIELGRWPQVREIVSVSGGGPPNAALLTGGGRHVDVERDTRRLAEYYGAVVADRSRPFASVRRPLLLASLGLVVGAAVVGVALAARWNLVVGLVGAAVAFPFVLQVGRLIVAAYFRDTFRLTIDGGGVRLADAHDPTAARQHVFCATGLSSGAPYHLWVGGSALFVPDEVDTVDRDVRGPADDAAATRWGVEIGPELLGDLTVEDAVMASASLPLVGSVPSPVVPEPLRTSGVGGRPERLLDGGASGVFGLQVAEAGRSRVEVTRSSTGVVAAAPLEIVAVDAFRHRETAEGAAARVAEFVRDRVSSLFFLIDNVKVMAESLYVNDLSDTLGIRLIRLCSPDLDPIAPDASDGSSWQHDWRLLVERRAKAHVISSPTDIGRPPIERLADLRTLSSKVGLFGLNEVKAETVLTTAVVATYVSLRTTFDDREAESLLRRVGDRLDAVLGDGSGRGDRMVNAWRFPECLDGGRKKDCP